MKEIDALLDEQPGLAMEMVKLDNRNRQAHKELQLYNDHKTFLYAHPLLVRKKEEDDILSFLTALKQNTPEAFVKECYNTVKGLNRYKKLLENNSFDSEEDKLRCLDNLDKYTLKHSIIQILIK
ncbi:MAG: hypothetical protein LBI65_02110 [Candidatus Symbiothrix sp.]|jgi:hypothetical protein|nr:hypothetical protein [Candidatus Symbiothrix sp.]